eukprot:TRINITY_DN323_c0_g1_i1.p1 TRINITY_DN323_c0_g1~~TRINITY_DN323_c0_g1_i1.p1  ORF type:complete len:333 (-),score=99.93 TRINITY_DN323_c0_g1_i1:73-1041(-)
MASLYKLSGSFPKCTIYPRFSRNVTMRRSFATNQKNVQTSPFAEMSREEVNLLKSKSFLEQAERSRTRWVKENNPSYASKAELSLISAVTLLKMDHQKSEELPKALFSLGEILQTVQRPSDAQKAYEECLTFCKDEQLKLKVLLNLSEVKILAGKFKESLESFEETQKSVKNLSSHPRVAEAILIANNAVALFAEGQIEGALKQAKKAAFQFAEELGFNNAKTREALQNVITIIRSQSEHSEALLNMKNEWKKKMNEEAKKFEELGASKSKGKTFEEVENLWTKQKAEDFNPNGFFLPQSVAKIELEGFEQSTKVPLHIQVS